MAHSSALQPHAFRGDPDVAELRDFFLPEHHFDGDTLWSFGTSLKAAYVDSYEFMNCAPVIQLWRDGHGALQAVSRLSFGMGEWFHQAKPAYRSDEVTELVVQQADSAFALLTGGDHWETVRYRSKTAEIEQLVASGYREGDVVEVYMTRSLDDPIINVPHPVGIRVERLDVSDPTVVHERALAQVDAFSERDPTASEVAWMVRSLPHQLGYGGPDRNQSIGAVDGTGAVVAFADPFYDVENRIGEFEPVGVRRSHRGVGLSKVVLARGLAEMRDNGMRQAIVRTGIDNAAAVAAYESVGFVVTDHLVRFRKTRGTTSSQHP